MEANNAMDDRGGDTHSSPTALGLWINALTHPNLRVFFGTGGGGINCHIYSQKNIILCAKKVLRALTASGGRGHVP